MTAIPMPAYLRVPDLLIGPQETLPYMYAMYQPLTATDTGTGFVAPVYWEDGQTHNIAKFRVLHGTCTAGTGSTLRYSFQGVSTTSQGKPDGVINGSYTTTTMPTTGSMPLITLDTPASNIAHGQPLAFVAELTVFGATTYIRIMGMQNYTYGQSDLACYGIVRSGGIWNPSNTVFPNIVLESDDATPVLGTFMGGGIFSAVNSHSGIKTSTTPDEYANIINFDVAGKISGIYGLVANTNASADFDMTLFPAGGSPVVVSVDATQRAGNLYRYEHRPIANTSFATGDTLISVKPSTTNGINLYSLDVSDAAYWRIFRSLSSGVTVGATTRTDGGAWAATTTTRRYLMGVYVSELEGGGASGVPVEHARMDGGF